ncbi:hypothetical protein EST38_g4118 [Candolleomyces aberdarensis]|uniref:Amino acid transporter n=1 Tax=Candolleomyces aberdarensis TaxID=2316362 RepID=A0A4V1Q4D9_9AGAR|nr:hypothetical protein EST38_g4118 [Candolleomyces aberdarensis]
MTSDTGPAKPGSSSRDVEEPDETAPLLGLAPIEKINPLGKEVTLLTAFMLNVGQITGSGIYAVPGVILNSVGSIGLLLVYWLITPLFAFGEVRGRDPVRTVRKASLLSLSAASILFFFINVAYVAAVPAEEIRNSGQLVAVLFFQRVFGQSFGTTIFPLLVSLSCFGNIIAVTVGQARIIREVARQGLLPYPSFFASTRPFGTPLGPVALKAFLTVIVILAVPARDTFNFVLDLASYPNLIFQAAMVVGVWILRKRRAEQGIPPSSLQARNALIIAYLTSCILLLVLPWVPPEPGHADVSFWYATYCVAGLALIAACGVYYVIWVIVLPKLGGYEIVEEVEELDGGARNTRLVRRYKHLQEEDG